MKVVVSCSEKNNIGFLLVNVFLSQRNKKFPLPKDTCMILKDVRIIEEKIIRGEEAVFQTTIGGGVVVREHNKEENKDIYYSVGNERFEEVLNWLMKERFKRLGYPEDIFKDRGPHDKYLIVCDVNGVISVWAMTSGITGFNMIEESNQSSARYQARETMTIAPISTREAPLDLVNYIKKKFNGR